MVGDLHCIFVKDENVPSHEIIKRRKKTWLIIVVPMIFFASYLHVTQYYGTWG